MRTATRAAVAGVAWTAGERTMRRATSIRLTSGQRTLLRTSFESTNAVASISFPSTVASKRDSPALLPALYLRYPESVAPLTHASIVPLTPGASSTRRDRHTHAGPKAAIHLPHEHRGTGAKG